MDRLRAAVPWVVLAGMTLYAGWFIARHAGRAPMIDEYYFLDHQLNPNFPGWDAVLGQLNEHRVPLPRFAIWALTRVFGYRLKLHMDIDLAVLVAVAAAGIVVASRIRGRASLADAFFPLVLLTTGQWENLLWAVQINFFLPVALQCGALMLIAGAGGPFSTRRLLGIAFCAVGLTGCGMPGVLTAAPLAAWMLYVGLTSVATDRRFGMAAVALGTVVAALAAANFIGYKPTVHAQQSGFSPATIRYAIRFLGGAWGPVSEDIGPVEQTGWPPVVGVVTTFLLGVTAVPLIQASRDPGRRTSALGMAALAVGLLAIAAAIGAGRAEVTAGILMNRYTTLAVPLLCWVFLVWLRYGAEPVGTAMTAGLALTAGAFAGPNLIDGRAEGWRYHTSHTFLERDILMGVPPSFLAYHHQYFLYPPDPESLPKAFELLRANGVAPFNRMAEEPRLTETPAVWKAEAISPETTADGRRQAKPHEDAVVRVVVESPDEFVGLRVRYSQTGPRWVAATEAQWMVVGPNGDSAPVIVLHPLVPAEGGTRKLWVGRGVKAVTFVVKYPGSLRIEDVRVYVPQK